MPQILGVPAAEWQRLYYEEDVLGRCVGRVVDSVEAMRLVTHAIDATVSDERILAAVENRRRRFEAGLIDVDRGMLAALDRSADMPGIRTALVSDAGADDVECWPRSPLRGTAGRGGVLLPTRRPQAGCEDLSPRARRPLTPLRRTRSSSATAAATNIAAHVRWA